MMHAHPHTHTIMHTHAYKCSRRSNIILNQLADPVPYLTLVCHYEPFTLPALADLNVLLAVT